MSTRIATRAGVWAAMLVCVGMLAGGTATAETAHTAETEATFRIDRSSVQEALDAMTSSGAQGVQARVTHGNDHLEARSGTAELDGRRPVPHDGRFRIGSVTKVFVSTVVLQLVGEGKVNLDAPVSRYLPGALPDGQAITVRMLLQHTSGLYNYTGALPLDFPAFEGIRYRQWALPELVAISTAKPLDFAPGINWSYSNTNYIVAGMLIEKITGQPYGRAVEQRILRPLELRATSVPGNRVEVPGPHAHGYARNGDRIVDITEINPSVAASAGEIISTTGDLDRFIDALLDGRLLAPKELDEMTRMPPFAVGYGLGIERRTLGCGVTVWGHGGGIIGYSSLLLSTRDTSKRLELLMTSAPDGGDVQGTQQLLDEVFCP